LNVVDAVRFPVILASYRQSKFGVDNISWGFVKSQTRDFVDEVLNEDNEEDDNA
jgi:hypothetical protein